MSNLIIKCGDVIKNKAGSLNNNYVHITIRDTILKFMFENEDPQHKRAFIDDGVLVIDYREQYKYIIFYLSNIMVRLDNNGVNELHVFIYSYGYSVRITILKGEIWNKLLNKRLSDKNINMIYDVLFKFANKVVREMDGWTYYEPAPTTKSARFQ